MIHDLKIIEPLRDHRLVLTSDYGINIVDTKTSMSVAEKVVIRNVISRNTTEVSYTVRKTKGKTEERKMKIIPKHSEIIITRKSLVYCTEMEDNPHVGRFRIQTKCPERNHVRS